MEWNVKTGYCFEMLKIWLSSSLVASTKIAWLALRNEGEISFSKLEPKQQASINDVLSFFRKLNVLLSRNLLDKSLARDLFLEDANYWCDQFDRLTADKEQDKKLLEWYKNYVCTIRVHM